MMVSVYKGTVKEHTHVNAPSDHVKPESLTRDGIPANLLGVLMATSSKRKLAMAFMTTLGRAILDVDAPDL